MRRNEIARQFDEIVGFAEVERFIDAPVKHYSSGMYLRLAFAVAAHLEPEILLVDEVLAVGDAAFQKKCLGKMGEVAHRGKTVIFVSHDMRAVLHLCGQGILLQNGRLERSGGIGSVVDAYLDSAPEPRHSERSGNRTGDGAVRISAARFRNAEGIERGTISSGDALVLELDYESRMDGIRSDSVDVDVTFRDALQHPVFTISTRFAPIRGVAEFPKTGTLRCQIESMVLVDGRYDIDVWVRVSNGMADMVRQAATITVVPTDFFGTGEGPVARKHGSLLIPHRWSFALTSRGNPNA
jgi:homopolymeric O-antigen transport system ATP-binding protein